MCQETASQLPAETYGFGVHNWWLKVCFANFFISLATKAFFKYHCLVKGM